jgi:uroporphyrinogen-III synthase
MKKVDLKGLKVLNTRPLHQAEALNEQIRQASGQPLSFPALEIRRTEERWYDLLPPLETVSQAIFTSANAVDFGLAYLQGWPSQILITTIGKATAERLLHYNLKAYQYPHTPDSEHLLALPSFQSIKNQTILVFKGEGGRVEIEKTLKQRGAKLSVLNVYQRQLPKIDSTRFASWWQESAVDIILFTSQQAMENIFHLLGPKAKSWLMSTACLVISQRLAEVALAFGMQSVHVGRIDSIIETLDLFQQSRK